MKMQKVLAIVFGAVLMAGFFTSPVLAAGGSITQLNATGGSVPNDTIGISSAGAATSKISTSNLYYTITSPSNTVVATHSTSLSSMDNGDTFTDSWTTNNAGWPMGTYTVTLCWSTGGSNNCNIDSASTTFYSVPTLGWELNLAGLGFLLYVLWRRRKEFEPVAERIRA